MDTLRALDNYRMPIASDMLGTAILAILAREGVAGQAQLSQELNSERPEILDKIRSLYRASMVRMIGNELWATSGLGDELIARLGITATVNQELVTRLGLSEVDAAPVRTWLDRRSDDHLHTRFQLSALRNTLWVAGNHDVGSAADLARLTRAVVFGLDGTAKALGADEVSACFGLGGPGKSALAEEIRTAFHDQDASGSVLIHVIGHSGGAIAREYSSGWSRGLADLRVVGFLETGIQDEGLRWIHQNDGQRFNTICQGVAAASWDHSPFLRNRDRDAYVTEMCHSVDSDAVRPGAIHVETGDSIASFARVLTNPPLDWAEAVARMRVLREAIERGQLAGVESSHADQLGRAIGDLAEAFARWTRSPQPKPVEFLEPELWRTLRQDIASALAARDEGQSADVADDG